LEVPPLSNKDRRRIIRDHGGRYPVDAWPNSLVLKDSTKLQKEVQSAKKISLASHAQEISKAMDKNRVTLQMVGTTRSRVLEMRAELIELVTDDPDINFRGDDVVAQYDFLEGSLKTCSKARSPQLFY
jgi:hypothetical protein